MRSLLFIGALGCSAAPEVPRGEGSQAGTNSDLYAYNETRYASSIVVEVDGVQSSFGEGEFYLTRVVGDAGTCATSGLFRVRTLADDLTAELYFDSDTLEGEAIVPTAPYEHESFPLWVRELNGVEFAMLSGGTATYEQVGTEYRVAVEGTSLCAAPDSSAHEVDPATCDAVDFVLTLTGTLGSAPDEVGSPGWSSAGGTPVCIVTE